MKRILLIAVGVLIANCTMAQQPSDSLYVNELQEVKVRARWKNDTERYHYNQMKHYVSIVLPYVNASTALFKDIKARDNDPSVSRHEYKKYIKTREHEMRTQFEDKVKSLNVTQGVLLVKLIARQTDMNLYKMIQEVKNPIAAIKWQSWALVNGMNLDRKYHPEDEPDLENIMSDLGYPLPPSYASRN